MEEILKNKLIKLAKKEASTEKDDFSVFDYSGGNIDDAYYMGAEDGEILLAREILETFCIKYK